ncbi:hypothetical protein HaLaN_02611 [Haematococcus lacustris]|uniref:Uncharacterized protein n=1 Tax=Haematococcus lacustris TaxID=44745 RepID=A0A699YXL5_HAELA|nr:hypothetical protein HaLaN_02611 [Haematococcus lacustris]
MPPLKADHQSTQLLIGQVTQAYWMMAHGRCCPIAVPMQKLAKYLYRDFGTADFAMAKKKRKGSDKKQKASRSPQGKQRQERRDGWTTRRRQVAPPPYVSPHCLC